MNLIAFAGDDKENWGQITALVKRMDIERAIVVKNKTSDEFPTSGKEEIVIIDTAKPLLELKQNILDSVKKKIGNEFEVALSLASGNGKEHMALLSALLSIPVGVKLAVYTKDGVQFIS